MPEALDDFAKQKQELLLESEINRQILQLEFNQLQSRAVEWRQGLTKFSTAYKWMAPLAGAGLGFLTARQQSRKPHPNGAHDASSGLGYLTLLAPVGTALLRRAYKKWRRSQRPVNKT